MEDQKRKKNLKKLNFEDVVNLIKNIKLINSNINNIYHKIKNNEYYELVKENLEPAHNLILKDLQEFNNNKSYNKVGSKLSKNI